MARGKYATINLNKINGFIYALQVAPEKVKSNIKLAVDEWARDTKSAYDSAISYTSGFSKAPGRSFAVVERAKKFDGLYVSVGHEAYIARFLEVGTKAHDIPHKNGQTPFVVHVSGIKGSKALSKAWNRNRSELKTAINKAVTYTINGGVING